MERIDIRTNVRIDTHSDVLQLQEREEIMMIDLLKKIYEDTLVYEQDVAKTNIQADKEIDQLIEPYIKQLTTEEFEKLYTLISETTYIAELAGFENGVKFTVKLLHSLLSD